MTSERAASTAGSPSRPPGHRRWLVNTIGQTLAVVGPVEPAAPAGDRDDRDDAWSSTGGSTPAIGRGPSRSTARCRPTPMRRSAPSRTTRPRGSATGSARRRAYRPRTGATCPARPRGRWSWPRTTSPGAAIGSPRCVSGSIAARAGTTTDRYFGRSIRHAAAYAWYIRNTDNHAEPVGRKRPNDFGLFDVLGNLLEWCYNPDPPHDGRCDCPATIGADCRKVRLVSVRGGGYSQPEGGLTVAAYSPTLDRLYPDEAFRYIGFRVARLRSLIRPAPPKPIASVPVADPRFRPSLAMPASCPDSPRPGELHGQRDRYPPEDRFPDVHDPAAAGAAHTPTTARTDATTDNRYGCSANCSCSPIICGLGSQIIQALYPGSAKSTAGVSLTCTSAGSDEEACANSLLEVIRGLKRGDDLLEAGQHRAGRALRPAGDRPGRRGDLPLKPGRWPPEPRRRPRC